MIAHLIPYLACDFGGQVFAMAAMADGLATQGETVAVFSVQRPAEGHPVQQAAPVATNLYRDASWGSLRHSNQLWSALRSAQPRLIHSHGLWTDVNRCAAVMARQKGIPHVLGPCGMLDPTALKRSAWKKQLVGAWFQTEGLRQASCLLANSEQEYQDIRNFGLRNPVAIVPNPVPGPGPGPGSCANTSTPGKAPFSGGRNTALFLGRIHPVKGLSRLVEAWSRLSAAHPDWQLVLAGPDEGGHRAVINAQITRLGCGASVHFTGPLDTPSKWAALQAADLFVMPSDFENFGLAIVEAMMASLPVITTTGTPWKSLAEKGIGWWVDPSASSLELALAESMNLSDDVRAEMGRRASQLANEYSPENITSQLLDLYGWLQGAAARPDFVQTD
jgi:glycosyltransferase involved in cell wall biosynthesis